MPGLVTEFPVIASRIEKALVDERDYQKVQRQADTDCNEEGSPKPSRDTNPAVFNFALFSPTCRSPPNAAPNS
jgi:hypothetical protein